MKLLIITQTVDKTDPVLGFFHGWIEEFAKRFKSIVVICLFKNKSDLPGNVAVLSLGKEKWRSKMKYVFLLFYFSLRYFNRYDAVFVHMNEEYVLLAGWLWRITGKKVYMWRNHHAGNIMTDVASIFCNKVFCTSKYSYTAKYKKTVLMPVGIDTNLFKIQDDGQMKLVRQKNSILFLGRIAPSKNVHVFIEALNLLKERGIDFTCDIYGEALPKDASYFEQLKSRVMELHLDNKVKFCGRISNFKTPQVYSTHEMFINLSSSGMYDKTIFEAMACGCITLASNDNLKGHIDEKMIIPERQAEKVAQYMLQALDMTRTEKEMVINGEISFAKTQSLENLSSRLVELMA